MPSTEGGLPDAVASRLADLETSIFSFAVTMKGHKRVQFFFCGDQGSISSGVLTCQGRL